MISKYSSHFASLLSESPSVVHVRMVVAMTVVAGLLKRIGRTEVVIQIEDERIVTVRTNLELPLLTRCVPINQCQRQFVLMLLST